MELDSVIRITIRNYSEIRVTGTTLTISTCSGSGKGPRSRSISISMGVSIVLGLTFVPLVVDGWRREATSISTKHKGS